MKEIIKNKRVKIGKVYVDSGQMLLCDPRFIQDMWDDKDTNMGASYYIAKDGKKWGCKLHESPGAEHWFDTYDQPLKEYGGKTPSELKDSGDFMETFIEPSGKLSYGGCCQATLRRPEHAGQLEKDLAVAVSTGYGDGSYPVYATYNKDGRIVIIEVVMTSNPLGL